MEIFLIIALVFLIGAAVFLTVRRARKGSACCGSHEKVALTGVSDRNEAHYPYRVSLEIGGMTCENCARKVANALNALDGAYARVSLDRRRARLLLKEAPDERAIRRAVMQAGYTVLGYSEE